MKLFLFLFRAIFVLIFSTWLAANRSESETCVRKTKVTNLIPRRVLSFWLNIPQNPFNYFAVIIEPKRDLSAARAAMRIPKGRKTRTNEPEVKMFYTSIGTRVWRVVYTYIYWPTVVHYASRTISRYNRNVTTRPARRVIENTKRNWYFMGYGFFSSLENNWLVFYPFFNTFRFLSKKSVPPPRELNDTDRLKIHTVNVALSSRRH